MGLDAGGDDYLSKPFDLDEMLARTRAALRRAGQSAGSEARLRTADLVLDPIANTVMLVRNGQMVRLTSIETRLLHCLLSNPGRDLPRETLITRSGTMSMRSRVTY